MCEDCGAKISYRGRYRWRQLRWSVGSSQISMVLVLWGGGWISLWLTSGLSRCWHVECLKPAERRKEGANREEEEEEVSLGLGNLASEGKPTDSERSCRWETWSGGFASSTLTRKPSKISGSRRLEGPQVWHRRCYVATPRIIGAGGRVHDRYSAVYANEDETVRIRSCILP